MLVINAVTDRFGGDFVHSLCGPESDFTKILKKDKKLDELDALDLNFALERLQTAQLNAEKLNIDGVLVKPFTLRILNKLWTEENPILLEDFDKVEPSHVIGMMQLLEAENIEDFSKLEKVIYDLLKIAFMALTFVPKPSERKNQAGKVVPVYDLEFLTRICSTVCPLMGMSYDKVIDQPLGVVTWFYVQWLKMNSNIRIDRPSTAEIEEKRHHRIAELLVEYIIDRQLATEDEKDALLKEIWIDG